MGVFLAALRFQVLMLRGLSDLHALVTAPLFTLALVPIMLHAGRIDLAPYAVVASTVISVWSMALLDSGEIISAERENGTLEALVGVPASLTVVVLGRTATTTVVSMASLVESAIIAKLCFGIVVPVHHPVIFALTLIATAAAMSGTATAFAGLFVLARSARTFQNSLSYPFYILSGAAAPVSLLPDWLQPVARVVFLSWSTDLIRDCLRIGDVPDALLRIGAIIGLGGLAYAGGVAALGRIVDRVRSDGTVGYA